MLPSNYYCEQAMSSVCCGGERAGWWLGHGDGKRTAAEGATLAHMVCVTRSINRNWSFGAGVMYPSRRMT